MRLSMHKKMFYIRNTVFRKCFIIQKGGKMSSAKFEFIFVSILVSFISLYILFIASPSQYGIMMLKYENFLDKCGVFSIKPCAVECAFKSFLLSV